MRICRFDDNRLGVVTEKGIPDGTELLPQLPAWTYPLPVFDPLVENLPKLRSALEQQSKQSAPKPLKGVRLLTPVANPGKIIAAPVNYKKHLEEVLAQKELHHGNLINEIHRAGLFLKATSSLIGAGQRIELVHLDRGCGHRHRPCRCRVCPGTREGSRMPQSVPNRPEEARALERLSIRILPK